MKKQFDLRKITVNVSMLPFDVETAEPKDIGFYNIDVKAVGNYAFIEKLVKLIEQETGENIL